MSSPGEITQNGKKGMSVLSVVMPETIPAGAGLMGAVAQDGAFTYREKELIAIGVALSAGAPL